MKTFDVLLLSSVLACQSPIFLSAQSTSAASAPGYSTSTVIKVCDVKRAEKPLEEVSYRDAVTDKFVKNYLRELEFSRRFNSTNDDEEKDQPVSLPARRIESFSRDRAPIIEVYNNGFFDAAYRAYSDHRPLVISPDMIWLLIAQGFAIHVNENAEKLRHHFVTFEGKKVLNVQREMQNFPLGRDENDWEGVFTEFKQQIAGYTGKEVTDLIAARFSATPADAQVAFDITLMDAMKNYFDYTMSIACGIPEITLEGTIEDWQSLENRAAGFANYDLEWWLNDLKPILAGFTKTARGQGDPQFWSGLMKIHTQAAGCTSERYITGWIGKFYPYIKGGGGYVRNPMIGAGDLEKYITEETSKFAGKTRTYKKYSGPKVEPKDLPKGVSSAELLVDYNGTYHKMELKAGFFGIRQSADDLALRPVIGWAVIQTGEQPEPDVIKRYEEFIKYRNSQVPVASDVRENRKN